MMRVLRLIAALVCCTLAANAWAVSPEDLASEAVKLINRERKRHALPRVTVDAQAMAAAQARAGDLAAGDENRSPVSAHDAGAAHSDWVSENLAGWSFTYAPTEHLLLDLVRRSHASMMEEVPPLDGRRDTILDPFATHVGVGVAWSGGRFRIVELFLRRHVALTHTPAPRLRAEETLQIAGRPSKKMTFDSITVHRADEPGDVARPPDALPERIRDYLPRLGGGVKRNEDGTVGHFRYAYGEARFGEVELTDDGEFALAVPFDEGPGRYFVVVWLRSPEYRRPFPAAKITVEMEDSPMGTLLPPTDG